MDAFFKAFKAKFQEGGETKKKKGMSESEMEAWKKHVKNKKTKKVKITKVPGASDFKTNSTPPDPTLRVRDEYKNYPTDKDIKKKTKKKGRHGSKS